MATPWRDNSSFATTYYSILTAMVGAVMALAIGDREIAADWCWPIGLLSFSVICFMLGIEKYGEAVDDNDVDKYLVWLLAYNFGAVCMFYGIASYIGLHYHVTNLAFLTFLFIATLFSLKWLKDSWFLLFANEESYEVYRQEQLGNREPEGDRDLLMKLHGVVRRLRCGRKVTPYQLDLNSFTRLKPSSIHGVGVFAIRDIPKDTNIFKDDESEMVWIKRSEVEAKSGEARKLFDDFCVIKNDQYGCPKGFNNLTLSWYINQPAKGQEPNVVCCANYDFVAARDISAGKELTVDYATYSEKRDSTV